LFADVTGLIQPNPLGYIWSDEVTKYKNWNKKPFREDEVAKAKRENHLDDHRTSRQKHCEEEGVNQTINELHGMLLL